MNATNCGLIFLSVALLSELSFAVDQPESPRSPLIGTWRVVSYPTSEGDLLRRHGRDPGPLPEASSSLRGWSNLVFAADGRCALFYPENRKGEPSHRRIAWQHDEDNFARWKLDRNVSPWNLDLTSVACPVYHFVPQVDPTTGAKSKRRELVIDEAAGQPQLKRWRYPAICRIDGDLLTITWWQNHQLLESPQETSRPKDFGVASRAVVELLNQREKLERGDSRITLPGGVSCLICQRHSLEALDIPDEPLATDALPKPANP